MIIVHAASNLWIFSSPSHPSKFSREVAIGLIGCSCPAALSNIRLDLAVAKEMVTRAVVSSWCGIDDEIVSSRILIDLTVVIEPCGYGECIDSFVWIQIMYK